LKLSTAASKVTISWGQKKSLGIGLEREIDVRDLN
jgi:hypothetical protein